MSTTIIKVRSLLSRFCRTAHVCESGRCSRLWRSAGTLINYSSRRLQISIIQKAFSGQHLLWGLALSKARCL